MYEALWHEVGPSRGSILLRTATQTMALLLLYLETVIEFEQPVKSKLDSAKEPGAGILKVLLTSFVPFVHLPFALKDKIHPVHEYYAVPGYLAWVCVQMLRSCQV